MLYIPQLMGTELNDVVPETRDSREWIRFGSYLFRPQETVQVLNTGAVAIGADGLSEWRSLNATAAKTVTITPAAETGRWKLYDADFKQLEAGRGAKTLTLSGGMRYLLFHNSADVNVQ